MILPLDLETEVRVYLPIIFEILGEGKITPKQWRKINENYKKTQEKRAADYWLKDITRYEVNLYDVFEMRRKGNKRAYVFLDMLKKALEELCDALPVEDRVKLGDTIYHMLVQFDHKHRNYIGELLVLNNAVKKQQFSLVKIEAPITKTTSADFLLKNKSDGKEELVEVVNIHIKDTQENLKQFITGKLTDKMEAKTKGEAEHPKFTLVPVVWASFKVLRKIEKLYDEGDGIELKDVAPPCAFASFDYKDTIREFRVKFGTIPTLFKGENILEEE